jgi:hypothetical protein
MGQPAHSRMPHTGGHSPIWVTTFLASRFRAVGAARRLRAGAVRSAIPGFVGMGGLNVGVVDGDGMFG